MRRLATAAPRIDNWLWDLYAHQQYRYGEESDTEWLRTALAVALKEELTQTERECVNEYFMQRRTMAEIAKRRGVNVSTVQRNIARAKDKLFHVLKYTNVRLLKL